MLEPRDRTLLLANLKPPPGYRIDYAVGTSFSLDLMALMTAPLAFTFFDWEDAAGKPTADPLALLEAVRRHSDRIALFCQAGRISVPAAGRTFLLYLEDSVFEAQARIEGGLFHPKVWLLRYVTDDGPVAYRMLCLTRNLTFDRSWDTALVLDGMLEDRTNAFSANHPLGDFVAALPGLAIRGVPPKVGESIAQMADEVRRVRFELPPGFESSAFWPLGLDSRPRWPFPEPHPTRRLLIVSPFVSDGVLEKLTKARSDCVLISRPESLKQLKLKVQKHFEELFVLNPDADPEEEVSEDESIEGDGASDDAASAEESLAGLHAKLYVMDDGWDARVWTGSANATNAAFERNVEFLVELVGKKSTFGVDALLSDQEGGQASLRALLTSVAPSKVEDGDAEQEAFERALDQVRLKLGCMSFNAKVEQHEESDLFSLRLVTGGGPPDLPDGLEIRCRPVTLGGGASALLRMGQEELARFGPLTADALTGFMALEVTLRQGGRQGCIRFVVNAPLDGAPPDRRDRLLRSILENPQQVLRLIWLLLSEAEISVQDWVGTTSGIDPDRPPPKAEGIYILETMLKALDCDPSKLDDLATLIGDLRRTPEGAELLPPDLDLIWEPVWKLRAELRR